MKQSAGDRLPETMLAHVRDRVGLPVPPTRDAATIVLLRDSSAGLEAYLLRRVASMAFAAGMHVFPGGRVDPADTTAHVSWFGTSPDAWSRVLSADPPLGHGLVCAAVRETFEESGVLLAGAGPDDVVDVSGPDWEQERLALLDRRESLSSLLERRSLGLRADLLRPWAHWITPELEPKRYDTRFFVAALPPGQHTRHVGGEADATMWITAAEAVARFERDELPMMPPTIATLRELAEYATAADVLAAADSRDIAPVLPRVVVAGEDVELLLPHEKGYES